MIRGRDDQKFRVLGLSGHGFLDVWVNAAIRSFRQVSENRSLNTLPLHDSGEFRKIRTSRHWLHES